ncbi:Methylmalonic aciduria and homocystinuria type D like protein [Argiope bruennichi]|uniref:Methylmalonic aciduria and homocystinuria type D like protein n=1 Tax=Argiope bruennichi TaxID=94029 RepID=A0A8T0FZX2_ARGBR|nr:Methylmalonic aciduria and homocystinuria type D like protein [Argiope bruennichi]
MLTLLRQVPYFQNRKYVLSSFRCTYSRRLPAILSKLNFGDPTNNATEKKGYGEKEICLLTEIDGRTPLPGNMGGLPLQLLYTTKIQNLPTPTGDKWEASMPLAEEKYKSILSQYAYNVVDTAMSISNKVECIAHECPILLRRDFLKLFPARYLDENLTLVTLCLRTENDMSTWSEEAEKEREKLNQYFITSAKAITRFLGRQNFWADFVHPNTGKPYSSPLVDDVMFETDLRYRNFGLQIEDLGCCRIISHPIWETNVFVGAIFTNAPLDCFEVNCIKQRTLYPVLAHAKGTPL